jgi:uncharacterized protein YcbK (DUF882 family)
MSRARIAASMVALAVALSGVLGVGPAAAEEPNEIAHVVKPGQYLSLIAKRYHTTADAIRKSNGLSPSDGLKPGVTLRILETPEHRAWRGHMEGHGKKDSEKKEKEKERGKPGKSEPEPRPRDVPAATPTADKYAKRPARAGWVDVLRFNDGFRGQLRTAKGTLVPKAAEKLDWLLRSYKANDQMRMDRRLLKLLSQVSDHFGGRQIVFVSGFRPYTASQYTKHSRHNHGQAVDFRMTGVPNMALYEYCLTLPQVGCGYYPNSVFIHMDVRLLKTKWVDYSRPGQAPVYAHKDKPAPGTPPATPPAASPAPVAKPEPPADDDNEGDPEPGE